MSIMFGREGAAQAGYGYAGQSGYGYGAQPGYQAGYGYGGQYSQAGYAPRTNSFTAAAPAPANYLPRVESFTRTYTYALGQQAIPQQASVQQAYPQGQLAATSTGAAYPRTASFTSYPSAAYVAPVTT